VREDGSERKTVRSSPVVCVAPISFVGLTCVTFVVSLYSCINSWAKKNSCPSGTTTKSLIGSNKDNSQPFVKSIFCLKISTIYPTNFILIDFISDFR